MENRAQYQIKRRNFNGKKRVLLTALFLLPFFLHGFVIAAFGPQPAVIVLRHGFFSLSRAFGAWYGFIIALFVHREKKPRVQSN